MGRLTTQMLQTAQAGRSAIAMASLSIAILAMAVLTGAAQAATQTFSFTGAEQTFTVPSGVTSVQVAATGASGAHGDTTLGTSAPGGAGAHVSATLPVTPGQTLYVEVGDIGQCNGAGASAMEGQAGRGGGAADVRTVSVAGALCGAQAVASLQSRLIVAAGGGGGAGTRPGGGAGLSGAGGAAGQPGVDPRDQFAAAQPGTQTGGGAGASAGDVDGTDGSLGQGGAGGIDLGDAWGGGGGGGLYGGGGGGTYRPHGYVATGGGGGSSLVPAGGVLSAASGPAQVTIGYTVDAADPSVTVTTPADGATYARGESVIADYACADEAGGSGVRSCIGPVDDGAAIATDALGQHTFSVTATDHAGNDTTKTVSYTVTDQTDPTVTISSPVDGAQIERGASLPADYACADEAGGSGLASCDGTVGDGQPVDTSVVGDHVFSVTARDHAGNETTATVHYTVLDVTAPTIAIASPTDGQAIGRNIVVAAQYACADEAGGSGVATCTGTVASGQPLDTSTLGPRTFRVTATDHAGNTDTKTVAYTVVDVTAPTISAVTPGADTDYEQGATILADYSCADEPGGSGVATCTGTVPDGQPIDTTAGPHVFTIDAADNAGNTSSVTINYTGGDRVAPQISISSPMGSYGLLRAILSPPRARFACTDNVGGSGLASCTATADGRPVANGGAVPTGLGRHTFTVTATDHAGNVSTETTSYTITLL